MATVAQTGSGSNLGTKLSQLLMADDIVPGSEPSYELCKTIYLYHPLGQKIVEKPLELAQSQQRKIAVPEGPEDRVLEAFEEQWRRDGADGHIFNTMALARVYGISSIALLVDGVDSNKPIDLDKLYNQKISFNVFDPLNTAGSLVLNQNPNSQEFQHTTDIAVGGISYHRSKTCVMMNEKPVYISYTASAYGFVGRSVYQRSLFSLKSFVQTMVADDMVSRKAGVLVAKMKQAGSIVDAAMLKMFGIKRALVKEAETNNVLGISIEESVDSLNMQNLEGPLKQARHDIIENIASATPMPAKLLTEESLAEGFGEGTEDAKAIARYVDRVREQMAPLYAYFDKIIMHRAWNPEFYETIKRDFPDEYGDVDYKAAFYKWKNSFKANWPSLLKEPDSELIKVDEVKMRAAMAMMQILLPEFNSPELAENRCEVIKWAVDEFNSLKLLFDSPLVLDYESILENPPQSAPAQDDGFGDGGEDGEGGLKQRPPPRPFAALDSLRKAVEALDENKRKKMRPLLRSIDGDKAE